MKIKLADPRPADTAPARPAAPDPRPVEQQPLPPGLTTNDLINTPPLYLEDLADFDEFDFGGAAFGPKPRDAACGAGSAPRPLSARDLPRHQQRGLRFVDAKRLPLRRQAAEPEPPPSQQARQPAVIAPRALPLRKRPPTPTGRGRPGPR